MTGFRDFDNPMRGAHALGLLILMTSSACSFAVVKGPSSDPDLRNMYTAEECTTSKVPPLVDSGAALASGIFAAQIASRSIEIPSVDRGWGTGAQLGVMAVYVASATYGFIQTGRCDALRDELAAKAKQDSDPNWTPGLHGDEPAQDAAAPQRTRGGH